MKHPSTMRALVLGGAGYIGSVVGADLLVHGHEVTVADDLSRGHRWAVPSGARFERVDLMDMTALTRLLSGGFDVLLHFAALSLVGESVQNPTLYFRVNVGGTANLLDAMRANGVRRLVFSSTAAVYGEPGAVPILETAPTRPSNPYGASKLAVDELIAYEAAAQGIGAVSLRYFNVAGAAYGVGELHDPETHLIPLALRAANGGSPLKVFGIDYATHDGTAIRDYIHVEDLSAAHILAIGATQEAGHRVYNLGNGAGFSVREVIRAAEGVTGRSIPTVDAPRRAGDPTALVASSDRIRAELGWVPAKPEIESMIADAWEWMSANTDKSGMSP